MVLCGAGRLLRVKDLDRVLALMPAGRSMTGSPVIVGA
jgi:hypothetical protein